MPGLAFLAKKSWHTSNLKNIEKVWLAEQKSEQEQKKLAELQKQLEEERQIQELRQLQAASGHNVKHTDTSMDWMYEGPAGASAADQRKQSEEYLLGKIYKPQVTKTFDLSIPAIQGQQDNSWMNKVSTKNDTFTRMHEDPFILIKQEEKKKRDALISNPVKMEKIRASLSKDIEAYEQEKELRKRAKKELKKRRKQEKKDRKKEKKAKKAAVNDTNTDSSSSSSEDDDSDGGHGKEEASNAAILYKEQPRHANDQQLEKGGDRKRSDSRERRYDHDQSRHYSKNRDSRDRDRNRNRDRYEDRNRYPDRRDDCRGERSRSRSRSRNGNRNRDNSRDRRERSRSPPQRDSRYGLISKGKPVTASEKEYLGPRPDLLKKKEDARAEALNAKLQAAQRSDSVKKMSEEERLRRIAEMERDASAIDQSKGQVLAKQEQEHPLEDHSGRASFLSDMRSEVYRKTRDSDITSRIHENRYHRQSSVDVDDSESFLKKA